MPQRASVTVSPSSSRIRRSTPWVDGCCGTHVDDDPLVGGVAQALGDRVPVLAGDREDLALAGLARVGVQVLLVLCAGHQLYDLRWSGGGTDPPLYSTGMPPKG